MATPAKRRPGRPPLPGGALQVVQFRLRVETLATLTERAQARGATVSELVREYVEERLERGPDSTPPPRSPPRAPQPPPAS